MTTQSHSRPNYGGVFLGLLVLTVLEILAANLPVHKHLVIAALIGMAILKASLVAAFYMHLKFEKVLLTVLALAPLIFSVILVAGVGFDIGHIRS